MAIDQRSLSEEFVVKDLEEAFQLLESQLAIIPHTPLQKSTILMIFTRFLCQSLKQFDLLMHRLIGEGADGFIKEFSSNKNSTLDENVYNSVPPSARGDRAQRSPLPPTIRRPSSIGLAAIKSPSPIEEPTTMTRRAIENAAGEVAISPMETSTEEQGLDVKHDTDIPPERPSYVSIEVRGARIEEIFREAGGISRDKSGEGSNSEGK